jgi:hypothetical protein
MPTLSLRRALLTGGLMCLFLALPALAARNYAIVTQRVVIERVTPLSQEEFNAATRAYCASLTATMCSSVLVLRTAQYDTKPVLPSVADSVPVATLSTKDDWPRQLASPEPVTATGYKLSDILRSRWDPDTMRLAAVFRGARTAAAAAAAAVTTSAASPFSPAAAAASSALGLQSLPMSTQAMTFGKYLVIDFAVFPPDGPAPWQLATRIAFIQPWISSNIEQLYNTLTLTAVGTPTPGYFPAHCANGVQDADETDIDCGGAENTGCARCAGGAKCSEGADCQSLSCTGGICDAPVHVVVLASAAGPGAVISAAVTVLVAAAVAALVGVV